MASGCGSRLEIRWSEYPLLLTSLFLSWLSLLYTLTLSPTYPLAVGLSVFLGTVAQAVHKDCLDPYTLARHVAKKPFRTQTLNPEPIPKPLNP